jgi:hypothetical protein
MQNNPMPPGQQGPPNPNFSSIPAFEFDPVKGLNVQFSPGHLQQLMAQLMQGQQPQQRPQMQGQQPIIPPQQGQMQQQMPPQGLA